MQRKDYSERKAQEIDEEVSAVLRRLYDEAKSVLAEHRDALERISMALLERETLDTKELGLLLDGRPLPPVPPPVTTAKSNDPPPERAKAEPSETFPGDKLPDPEPVPG